MSYITLPAEHVRNMCRTAAKNIERYRQMLEDRDVKLEAQHRMRSWFFKPKTLEDAIHRVKQDSSFMGGFGMQFNRVYAGESYESILDLGYAAKHLMDNFKTDCPPVHVSVKDMTRLDTWQNIRGET